MKLTITGSGGFRTIPRVGCHCKVCDEARKKGYRRLGPSMFIHDHNILFDTPEDIVVELEDAGIERIEHLFYTHWHPDHTFGARILEQANTTWSDKLEWRIVAKACTIVHMPPIVKDEIMQRLGAFFKFWELVGVAKVQEIDDHVMVDGMKISPIVIESCHRTMTHSTVYLIEEDGKKVVYAPCDITPFPRDERFGGCDLMILQTGWWGERMGARAKAGPHYEISLDQILKIIDEYRPERVVLTHIGDELEMCLDDLKAIEEKYSAQNIEFAYDGMQMEL